MATNTAIKLEIGARYSKEEIFELGMKPLHIHEKDYAIYKKEAEVYFFEKLNNNLYRLYCSTN